MQNRKGFTLIEMLTVMGIIAIIGGIVFVATGPARKKGRDGKRKFELAQIGRFMAGGSCYKPDAGDGDYDLGELFGEVKAKSPQVASLVSKVPRDPSGGTDADTGYIYMFRSGASRTECAIVANLENASEEVTLKELTEPTPGRGTGVLKGSSEGRNGTNRYFQVSN